MGSRDFHKDDISLDAFTFQLAKDHFGDFHIDCFASGENFKCNKFFSRRDVPGSAGVGFFMPRLNYTDIHWIFPPVSKLCQVVSHLFYNRSMGVILLPV